MPAGEVGGVGDDANILPLLASPETARLPVSDAAFAELARDLVDAEC